MKKVLIFVLLLFLSSCMATPDIHLKSSDMSMEIKQSEPIVWHVAVGRLLFQGGLEVTV